MIDGSIFDLITKNSMMQTIWLKEISQTRVSKHVIKAGSIKQNSTIIVLTL